MRTAARVTDRRVRELPPELVNGILCGVGACLGVSTHVVAWEQESTEKERAMWPHAPKATTRRKRACHAHAREHAERHGLTIERRDA